MVCACEDVGLAYPQIIPIVKAAVDAANMVGLPEARLPLADAVILVATSPKSNSAHDAINAAIADVQAGRTGPIPRQLQNKHFDGEDALVKGQNYKYAHDYDHHWVKQQYLPDALKDVKYYTYGDNRTEQAARAYWAKIKGEENDTVSERGMAAELERSIGWKREDDSGKSTRKCHRRSDSCRDCPGSVCGNKFQSAASI